MYEENWNNQNEPWEQNHYRTGRTHPPKTRRGLLAVFLVAMIFFTGVYTAVSLLNIRLFAPREAQEDSLIRFGVGEAQTDATKMEDAEIGLGLRGQILSDFDRYYYDLPEGVYITRIEPGSQAQKKGCSVGDVLVAVDDKAVESTEDLQQVLCGKKAGEKVKLTVYRNGKRRQLNVTCEEAK